MRLRTRPPGHDVLLYDGECSFCRAAAVRLQRMGRARFLEMRSYRTPGALEAFAELTLAQCDQAMQLVLTDGRVFSGAQAAVEILQRRPIYKVMLVYYVPVVRQIADAVYRLIAKNRMRLRGKDNCQDGTCAAHYTDSAAR